MVQDNMAGADAFSAPVPGESLTKPLGGAAYENPPQITDVEEAAEYVFNLLTKNAKEVAMQLKAGIPAETIARTILFAGFSKGVFTPDTAGLISRITLMQVVAIGHMMGIKKMKFTNRREDKANRMQKLSEFVMKNTDSEEQEPSLLEAPKPKEVQLPKFMRS